MQYEGSISFDAPKGALFQLLVDGEALAPCVPGIKSFEVVESGKTFQIVTQPSFGMIAPEMTLTVTFTLIESPDSARLRIRGRGGASHVGASSYIYLRDRADAGTELHWSFTFTVFGQLATLGNRLLNQAFEKMHQEFIDNIRDLVRTRIG